MNSLDFDPSQDQELVTMTADGAHFSVPVLRVRDVLDTPTIYRTPLAPPEIVGSINLRGRIVTAIDLRTRLERSPRPVGARCMCVIIERAVDGVVEPYALIVDEVGDVVTMPAASYEANPVTLPKAWTGYCRGLYRRPETLLIVLDVEALLAIGAQKLAA